MLFRFNINCFFKKIFYFADLGNVLGREGRVGTPGTGSRFRCGSRPARVERRVRCGASVGRQQQQQQQQQQHGAGEIEINNIFIRCNIRKSTIHIKVVCLSSILRIVSYIDLK